MRAMDPSIVRARAETRDGARARDRSASLSSCGTGLGDASGQDYDGDYLSAVDIAPYHKMQFQQNGRGRGRGKGWKC